MGKRKRVCMMLLGGFHLPSLPRQNHSKHWPSFAAVVIPRCKWEESVARIGCRKHMQITRVFRKKKLSFYFSFYAPPPPPQLVWKQLKFPWKGWKSWGGVHLNLNRCPPSPTAVSLASVKEGMSSPVWSWPFPPFLAAVPEGESGPGCGGSHHFKGKWQIFWRGWGWGEYAGAGWVGDNTASQGSFRVVRGVSTCPWQKRE